MDVQCPFCETGLEAETSLSHLECDRCHREFPVEADDTIECPGCGAVLRVPPRASVVLCGGCRRRIPVGPEPEAPPAPPEPTRPTEVSEETETSVFEAPRDFERSRLESIRREFADRYEVIEPLAQGGMGAIYKARQKQPERLVVLKLMLHGRFALEKYRIRFEREAQAVARLKHPNIVSVYEYGELAGQPYFTMEYVEGCSVKEYVRRHGLDKRGICELMVKISRAVAYAHQRGVIHRDLKPSNILVDGSGEPRLLDFGLARLVGDYQDEEIRMTEMGEVMGTPSYMSPEQTLGQPEEIDIRSDVYSIGVLFYELLTKTLPYRVDRRRPLESLRIIRDYIPKCPSEINSSIDTDLDSIVMKCLEKERDLRYQSAVELAEDIGRYLRGQPVEARPSTSFYHLRKLVWRHRGVFLPVAIGLFLLLTVTGGLMWHLARRGRQAREQARQALQERDSLVRYLLQLGAVRTSVNNLLAQGRWEDAYKAAVFAREHLPEEAGAEELPGQIRQRIAEATAGEAARVRRLIEQLAFREARERLRQLQDLAETVELPELASEVHGLQEEFDELCWQSITSYIKRNRGAVRVLERFLNECPDSPRAGEARRLLRDRLMSIRFTDWPFDREEALARQEATAQVLDVPVRRELALGSDVSIPLVLIPAGEFVMGASEETPGFAPDQSPRHRVRITNPFYVSSTPVTRRQFEAVTGRLPPLPPEAEGEDADDLPAAVSWHDAHLFCAELSRRTDLTVRLPTEAEWEYASRVGSDNVYGPAGSAEGLLEWAWFRLNADGPRPVGSLRANAWGLHDMFGNALEWCRDWYDSRYYFESTMDDPTGPEEGDFKVLRGGSWVDRPEEMHAAFRRAARPDSQRPTYGFRICVEVFQEETRAPVAQPMLSDWDR